jgi:pSer/pThr/pTyr-binding forkhead associated (FHA) protein
MAVRVTVAMKDVKLKEKEFVFETNDLCLIGRADDCEIQLPADYWHFVISRHHCMLELDAANAWVRDLGSVNGTFLNGELIGQRLGKKTAPNKEVNACRRRQLHDGDKIQLGNVILRIGIEILNDVPQSGCLAAAHQ